MRSYRACTCRVAAELLRVAPGRNGAREFLGEIHQHTRSLIDNDLRLASPLTPGLALDAIDVAPSVMGATWPEALAAERALLAWIPIQAGLGNVPGGQRRLAEGHRATER